MALAKMNAKQLQLPTDNQQLKQIWFAGATPQQFAQTMRMHDVELMDVPMLW